MPKKFFTSKQALAKFKEIGVLPYPSVRHLVGPKGLEADELQNYLALAKSMGRKNFGEFLMHLAPSNVVPIPPGLIKHVKEITIPQSITLYGKDAHLNSVQKLRLLVQRFGPAVQRMLLDPKMSKAGQVFLDKGHAPFGFRISINNNKGYRIISLSFDLGSTPKGKPVVTIGNFQVYGRAGQVEDAEKRVGTSHLPDLLIKTIIDAFKAENGIVLAKNPRAHWGHQHPSTTAVLGRLIHKGIITAEESSSYGLSKEFLDREYALGNKPISKVDYIKELARIKKIWGEAWVNREELQVTAKRVDELVGKEAARIKSAGIIAHKIAYKKAGFRVKATIQKHAMDKNGRNVLVSTGRRVPHFGLRR